MTNVFETLNSVDVNGHTDKRSQGGVELTYLSWPWAWAEVKSRYPNASYRVLMFDGKPYTFDEATGYMVFTEVEIDGVAHCMWLPVLDAKNFTMMSKPYTVKTKKSEYSVKAATMFDINKTIMRCLVKNLAMFGLGLYIYAREDLPEQAKADREEKLRAKKELDAAISRCKAAVKAYCEVQMLDASSVSRAFRARTASTAIQQSAGTRKQPSLRVRCDWRHVRSEKGVD